MESVWEVVARRHADHSRPDARTDGLRVVLAIEGGGMRGTIAAGMAEALHRAGLLDAFDAVYGSSAGSIIGAWLLSGDPDRLSGWKDPRWANQLIGWRNILARRPYVDVRRLLEDVYVRQFPLDYESVLSSPITLHPMATDASTGHAVDLQPLIATSTDLRRALRASCALPMAAGRPVSFAGGHYTDAGLSESVPVATAAAQGATHVLLLRTRHQAYVRPADPTGFARTTLAWALRATGHGPAVHEALVTRTLRADAEQPHHDSGLVPGPDGPVALATVWPATDLVPPSRTERNGARLQAAYDGGHRAFEDAVAAHLRNPDVLDL